MYQMQAMMKYQYGMPILNKIDVEPPLQMNFTLNSLFVSSPVYNRRVVDNKVIKINKGGNCIFEIDKESFEIERRIIGSWYSPSLMNIELNGNLQIAASTYANNLIVSKMRYFLTIDQKGKILKKVEMNEATVLSDIILEDKKIIAPCFRKLQILEFD